MSQRNRLPAADRELLERLERAAQDPAERARRRRLFDGDLVDFGGSCKRADEAMADLLTPAVGGKLDRRDRIVLLCVWGVERESLAPPPELEASAPARPVPTTPTPARLPATPPIRTESTVPVDSERSAAPTVRTPCTALAVDFVRFALQEGERRGREVIEAGRLLGLPEKMVRTARERLGVIVERRGFGPNSCAYWRLPVPCADPRAGLGVGASKSPVKGEQSNRSVAPSTNDVRRLGVHVVHVAPEPQRKAGQT